jgi:hypothetical protein
MWGSSMLTCALVKLSRRNFKQLSTVDNPTPLLLLLEARTGTREQGLECESKVVETFLVVCERIS